MNTETVALPTEPECRNAVLHYQELYTRGGHHLDLLHLIRQRVVLHALDHQDDLQRDYWATLDAFRHDFAAAVRDAVGPIDLLVDPPSKTGHHGPFLAAMKLVYPDANWVVFTKTAAVSSDPYNIGALRAAVKIQTTRPGRKHRIVPPKATGRVLIVDDVYATGSTAAVIIDALVAKGVPVDADVHIAAPLFIPCWMMGQKLAAVAPADLPKGD